MNPFRLKKKAGRSDLSAFLLLRKKASSPREEPAVEKTRYRLFFDS
ncbi:hypothetical protein HMPREF7215_0577 [Pyramidobacter piscolens W5455]|uniref:Uncharacterized protein n=1 Tax=Pyramidobacter piscolens W5455 TaxID=352165 RepID=A0ABM9ZUV9_9BACT|nr:hypothetical protein HMPREF7215_0577 [Pyramidobacter piscolens W5455]